MVLIALPPRCAVGVAKNCGSSSSCSAVVEPGLISVSSEMVIAVTGVGVAMPLTWRSLEPVTMISSVDAASVDAGVLRNRGIAHHVTGARCQTRRSRACSV